MPSGLGSIHCSRVFRVIYVLSVLLVFSYIFFDVLDFDGSNFPRLFTPVERTIIVAVVPSAAELNDSSKQSELCDDLVLLLANQAGLQRLSQWAELFRVSPVVTVRSHGYRVGLARNSLPDSSPYL